MVSKKLDKLDAEFYDAQQKHGIPEWIEFQFDALLNRLESDLPGIDKQYDFKLEVDTSKSGNHTTVVHIYRHGITYAAACAHVSQCHKSGRTTFYQIHNLNGSNEVKVYPASEYPKFIHDFVSLKKI